MAEQHDPVIYGELVEMLRRLDERVANMDRNIYGRLSSLDGNTNHSLADMRADIRKLTRLVMDSYAMMIGVAGIFFTLYKIFPNP